MKPEDAFTKSSLKRYNALRKALKKVEAPEGFVIVPGRERASEGVSDTVYVEVREYHSAGRFVSAKFYFHQKPHKKELKQIVRLLITVVSQ